MLYAIRLLGGVVFDPLPSRGGLDVLGGCPDESCQLASDGDDDFVAVQSTGVELAESGEAGEITELGDDAPA